MNYEQKKKIQDAQINALLAKLRDKKPLTAAQLQYVTDNFPTVPKPSEVVSQTDDAPDFIAASANDLANRLGVHRQIIAYHKGREGSPQTLSVKAWRYYLSIMGKLPTSSKMEGSEPTGTKCTKPFDTDTAFAILFDDLSESIGHGVKIGLAQVGVKLPPPKVDLITAAMWILFAARYQRLAHQHGANGPFDPVNDEGRCEYPAAIVKLMARIDKTNLKA